MFRLGLILLLIFSSLGAKAQLETEDPLTENFLFSVQTIDDFFDRFNCSPNSPFITYVRSRYPKASMERKNVIYSLFDTRSQIWDPDLVNRFAAQFSDSSKYRLSFEQSDWFAVLHCKVFYQKKRRSMDLIMRAEAIISSTGAIGYKWSLLSIKAKFLQQRDSTLTGDTIVKKPITTSTDRFLHPMSHAVNFMNVHDVFTKNQTKSYFAFQASSADLDSMVKWVNKGQLSLIQVDSVSYHLLQLPDWIIEVNYFERNEKNSGWLITKLTEASTSEDKKRYKLQQLNIK